jgi:hypothetical protein
MAEYLLASGSRKISVLTSVNELSGSTSMPVVMGGNTVQISHSNFLSGSLLSKTNIFSGNNTFGGQTIIQTGSVTGNLTVNGRISAASLTGSLSFNNLTDKPTLVSASSQITYSGISNTPSGIVSSSSQIISSLPSGTVSGSSQISYNGIVNRPNGIVSSSQQVLNYNVFTTISSFNSFTSSYNSGSFSGSFVGDGSGLTGVIAVVETGSFATTGSNTFIGNQTITGSVGVSGSVNANEFQLGSGVSNLENTAYWLYGNYNNDGAISFGFSESNVIANIDNVYINETSSDLNGAAIVNSLAWINGLVSGSVITIQGIDDAPSNLTQTIVLSVNSITDFSGTWAIGVSVLSYLPLAPSIAVNNSLYSLTYTTAIGDGSQYTITSDETRLLVSSSNTHFSGDVNITGSLAVTETIATQILLTPQLLTGIVTVPTGFNGMLTGPVSTGGEITIEGGSNLAII